MYIRWRNVALTLVLVLVIATAFGFVAAWLGVPEPITLLVCFLIGASAQTWTPWPAVE